MSGITPVLTQERYEIERAICDKAAAYAACDNDMRGRVEQFELIRDKPERFIAYIGSREPNGTGVEPEAGRSFPLQVWTGLQIGNCTLVEHSRRNRWGRVYQCYATAFGREYTGRTEGVGMYVNLKETAASKRKGAGK